MVVVEVRGREALPLLAHRLHSASTTRATTTSISRTMATSMQDRNLLAVIGDEVCLYARRPNVC